MNQNMDDAWKDKCIYGGGILIIAGLILNQIILMFHSIPVENVPIYNRGFDALLAMGGMIISYGFGSSRGSSVKNDIIANSTPIIPPTPQTVQTQTVNTSTVTDPNAQAGNSPANQPVTN